MTTYTTYTDGSTITSKSGYTAAGAPEFTTFYGRFDSTKRNLASTDVAEVITIPAGTLILGVVTKIVTAESTASQTFDVGDGTDPNGWVAAAASDAAAGTYVHGGGAYVIATGTSATKGKLYTAADTLDVLSTSGSANDTLVVDIWAYGVVFP